MTAVLAPRMNVDNCFKIFKYNGVGPVAAQPFEQIFDCIWQPQSASLFPNRGQSPRRDGSDGKQPVKIATHALPAEQKPAAPVAAYRPPSARGLSSGLAEKLKRDTAPVGKIKADTGTKYTPPTQRLIPGMAAPTQQAKKAADPSAESAKKEAKKKAEKERKEAKAAEKAAEEAAAKEAARIAALPKAIDELTPEEKEKRAKNLRKKLKNIDDLKARLAGGEVLNEDQKMKIDSVPSIMADLAKLGF